MYNTSYRNRRFRRRKLNRTNRTYKRRRVYRSNNSQLMQLYKTPTKLTVHSFSRILPDQVYQEGVADYKEGLALTFNMLPSYTEFITLFQQYRIHKAVMRWYPKTNTRGGITPSAQTTTPIVFIAYDMNDASPPGTIDDIRQLQNCRVYYGYRPFTFTYYPKPVTPVFQQGMTDAYATSKNLWIDTDYPGVEHYGVKIAIPASNSSEEFFQAWTVSIKVYFTLRGTK